MCGYVNWGGENNCFGYFQYLRCSPSALSLNSPEPLTLNGPSAQKVVTRGFSSIPGRHAFIALLLLVEYHQVLAVLTLSPCVFLFFTCIPYQLLMVGKELYAMYKTGKVDVRKLGSIAKRALTS